MTSYLWNSNKAGSGLPPLTSPRVPTSLRRPTPEALSKVRAAMVLVPILRLLLPLQLQPSTSIPDPKWLRACAAPRCLHDYCTPD